MKRLSLVLLFGVSCFLLVSSLQTNVGKSPDHSAARAFDQGSTDSLTIAFSAPKERGSPLDPSWQNSLVLALWHWDEIEKILGSKVQLVLYCCACKEQAEKLLHTSPAHLKNLPACDKQIVCNEALVEELADKAGVLLRDGKPLMSELFARRPNYELARIKAFKDGLDPPITPEEYESREHECARSHPLYKAVLRKNSLDPAAIAEVLYQSVIEDPSLEPAVQDFVKESIAFTVTKATASVFAGAGAAWAKAYLEIPRPDATVKVVLQSPIPDGIRSSFIVRVADDKSEQFGTIRTKVMPKNIETPLDEGTFNYLAFPGTNIVLTARHLYPSAIFGIYRFEWQLLNLPDELGQKETIFLQGAEEAFVLPESVVFYSWNEGVPDDSPSKCGSFGARLAISDLTRAAMKKKTGSSDEDFLTPALKGLVGSVLSDADYALFKPKSGAFTSGALSDLIKAKGAVIVMTSYGCPPCRGVEKRLTEMRQNLEFGWITAYLEGVPEISETRPKNGSTPKPDFEANLTSAGWERFGIRATPTTMLVDKTGKVVWVGVGFNFEEKIPGFDGALRSNESVEALTNRIKSLTSP